MLATGPLPGGPRPVFASPPALRAELVEAVPSGPPALPLVHAASYLLADQATGQVLLERGAATPRPMASTTKVMTALLVLERLDPRRTVVVGPNPGKVGEESLQLKAGERLTVHQLLLGLLLKSANDSAVALAEAAAGGEAAFVRLMNARAARLGLTMTHFVTPYGLDRPGHRTSARDLARLWEVAMRRPDFRALVATRRARIPGPGPLRSFTSTDRLLGVYPWLEGGKTGFTNQAGRCLVASARRGGRHLVAVALGSADALADARAMFDYGFQALVRARLAAAGAAVEVRDGAAVRRFAVAADVDALVRRDLLGRVHLVVTRPRPPSRPQGGGPGRAAPPGGAAGAARPPAWILAGSTVVAPLRLTVAGAGAAVERFLPRPVPDGAPPTVIDAFLRQEQAS